VASVYRAHEATPDEDDEIDRCAGGLVGETEWESAH
jgi:hypothetical protein